MRGAEDRLQQFRVRRVLEMHDRRIEQLKLLLGFVDEELHVFIVEVELQRWLGLGHGSDDSSRDSDRDSDRKSQP